MKKLNLICFLCSSIGNNVTGFTTYKKISDFRLDEFELIFLVYYNSFSLTDYAAKKNMPYYKIVRKENAVLEKIKDRLLEK